MTEKTVIEAGKNLDLGIPLFWDIFFWVIAALVVFVVFVYPLFISKQKIYNTWLSYVGRAFFVILGCFVTLVVYALAIYAPYQEKAIEKWKNDYVYPYIESLPAEKATIVTRKIDPEIKTTVRFLATNTENKMLTAVAVTYRNKENEIFSTTEWYGMDMESTKEEKAFLIYKELPKDLGHDIKAGHYNFVLYIPEKEESKKFE